MVSPVLDRRPSRSLMRRFDCSSADFSAVVCWNSATPAPVATRPNTSPATASRRQPDDTPAEDSVGAALAGFAGLRASGGSLRWRRYESSSSRSGIICGMSVNLSS